MIGAIVKIPERNTDQLERLIGNSVDELFMFNDHEHKGHWWNTWRAMEYSLPKAKKDEPVIITMDDVITVPEWRKYFEVIHSRAENNIYTLMATQKHLFTKENIDRGYVTKIQPRGWYDHAMVFINQQDLMQRLQHWCESNLQKMQPNRRKWLDVVIQEYFIQNNIEWTITIPTLFKHGMYKSVFGHKIANTKLYIGDVIN